MEYTCERCGYRTRNKKNMKQHFQRRYVCSPLFPDSPSIETLIERHRDWFLRKGDYKCEDCGKFFATQHTMQIHQRLRCKGLESSGHSIQGNTETAAAVPVQELLKKMEELTEKINRLETAASGSTSGSGSNLPPAQTHHNTNIYNTTTTNNIAVNINAFGSEVLDHLTHSFLEQCVRRTDKGLVQLIEKIHFDPDKPENNNIRITNKKLPYIEYHNGTKWKYEKKDALLNELVEKGHSILQDHYEENHEMMRCDMSESMFMHIKSWIERMEDKDKTTIESVLTDMYLLILNA